MALSKISDLSITDDTIKNADINSSAAIALTKLSGGIDLAATGAGGVTGILPIANGGTAATTLAGAGLSNTPAFSAELSGAQTVAGGAEVIIAYNTEVFDSDSAYNTTDFKFTPQTAGKYFISGSLSWNSTVAFYSELKMWKNGTGGTQVGRFGFTNGSTGGGDYFGARVTAIVDFNGSSDYVQIGLYQYSGSNKDTLSSHWMQFMGFLLIGA